MNREETAKMLVDLRGERSQQTVADDLGISVSAVCAYESAERTPRDELKVRIAEYYHTTVAALFFPEACHEK